MLGSGGRPHRPKPARRLVASTPAAPRVVPVRPTPRSAAGPSEREPPARWSAELGRHCARSRRLAFVQPPLSQVPLDLRHRLFIRNASDVAELPLGFRPPEAPAPRHDLLTAR